MTDSQTYTADLASLNSRPLPAWYDNAKFGIFIHWGMFAIPAYAEKHGTIGEVFAKHYDIAVAKTPYSEWYANAIKVPGSGSYEHHQTVHKGCPYQDFKQPFIDGLKHWDPTEWAEWFRKSGAKYVVLVTKHHDGFCLWPSSVANRHEANWFTERDIVGELAKAVRAEGLRFGVYYSGGIDWTFNREPLRTLGDFLGSMPGGDYPAYAMAQVRELIERYEPSMLWNDISWPTGYPALLKLFADYYNAIPDGVVNDRWRHASLQMRLMRFKLVRRLVDQRIRKALAKRKNPGSGSIPPEIPHSDFRTPEYTRFDDTQEKKWEATRGMSHSFGFNRNDRDEDYAPIGELLHGFIDGVSKNGNLLLNVGPRGADGSIPEPQQDRLAGFGQWLSKNGDAVYGTRPWTRAEAKTACGTDIRFTKKNGTVHAILLGTPTGTEIRIKDFDLAPATARLIGGAPVQTEQQGPDFALRLREPLAPDLAHAISFDLSDQTKV